MAEEILAYCVKEKMKKPMKEVQQVTLSNGKHALRGVCASCGTKMTKFISSKKAPPGEDDPHDAQVKTKGAPPS